MPNQLILKKGLENIAQISATIKMREKEEQLIVIYVKKKYIEHKRNWTVPKVKSIFAGNRVKLNGEIKNFPGENTRHGKGGSQHIGRFLLRKMSHLFALTAKYMIYEC